MSNFLERLRNLLAFQYDISFQLEVSPASKESSIPQQYRFVINLPLDIHDELKELANQRQLEAKEIVLLAVRLGLLMVIRNLVPAVRWPDGTLHEWDGD